MSLSTGLKSKLSVLPIELRTHTIDCSPRQLSGDYVESFMSKHLVGENGLSTDPLKQEYVKWACEALYLGGGDTVKTYPCDPHCLTVIPDCLGSRDLLSCHVTVSRSTEKSAGRYRPACVKSPADTRRLRLASLHQGNDQGGRSLGSCCSPGFAAFCVER